MEEQVLPGTTLPYYEEEGSAFLPIRKMVLQAGGFSLSQLCALTGLEGTTIQNWVKRGWIPKTHSKKYAERQVARVLLISALRDGLLIDQIAVLADSVNIPAGYGHAEQENEQLLYRVLEYAMENGYTNILVDDLLVDDMETLENVLFSLAYDSPLLEQNLRYEVGDFTTYHDVSVLKYFTRSAAFDGYYLCVNNFQPQWWEKKQEALQAAQAVVDALPDGLSPIETAERLYRHVANTVTYTEYPEDSDDAVYPYLYDGLITGKTHCDGYTNALALLLRLAGIENAEKDYTPDDSEEVGHTWNCMEIDGKWYNVDAVGEELLEYPARNAEAFPACEESFYMPVDGTFDSSDASGLPSAIVRGYDRHDDLWALVIITDYDDSDMDYQLQEVANRLWDTVYWMYFPLHDGRTALLVYDGSLYD